MQKFLVYFIPVSLLSLVISVSFYTYANKARRTAFRQQEVFTVEQQEKVIQNTLNAVVSDLQVLVDHYTFHTGHRHDPSLLETTTTGFQSFSKYKKVYDQIRLFDLHGMEKVRVDRKNGKTVAIPPEQLQNKGKRYYFIDTIALNEGELFVSPFDLNIEHGVVEEPPRPMIRLGMAVFDSRGKYGAIIINYAGKVIISSLKEIAEASAGSLMLINSDGYWLHSGNPEDTWGFMYAAKQDRTLGNRDMEAWKRIRSDQRGQFTTSRGLYTFSTITPFVGQIKSSSGSSLPFQPSTALKSGAEYRWKLVSFVSSRKLVQYQHPYLTKYICFTLSFIVLLGYGCWVAASASLKKQAAENKLRKLATVDTLTNLPNRNLFYDRLNQTLARAKRNRSMFAILFLDLDHFKEINDTLGHKAGDDVLQEVSLRMKGLLRAEDTIARVGGDEFIILLNTNSRNEAQRVLDKLADTINQPISLDLENKKIQRKVGISGGISIYPDDGQEAEILLSKADLAMYLNKNTG